jgi:hypothetical protein
MWQYRGRACRVPPCPSARRAAARRLGAASLLLALQVGGVLQVLPAAAQPAAAAEYQVKAAFLVKFGSYVEWPAAAFDSRDSPFVIAVAAQDPVADEVERAAAAAVVDGHPVQVRRVERMDASGGAHLLFIDRSRNGQLADTLPQVRGRPLLTVTESEQAFALGGMINFVIVENKVRFDIALAPAEASQLKISARLLAVARRVVKG